MALAEARAAWQRTANRCLVQEDAKRAPKLASCTSAVSPNCVKQTESEPAFVDNNGQDNIPNAAASLPFNRTPSYSKLSPNYRRWLQMQPSYGFQKVLMDEQCSSPVEGQEGDHHGLEIKDKYIGCEGLKSVDEDVYFFDSESTWIGSGGKNTPWWRTADTEELALLVAQRSLDVLENCDLPRPQNTHIKKGTGIHCFSHDDNEVSTSLLVRKPGIGNLVAEDCSRDLRKSVGDQLVPGAESASSPTNSKMHALEGDSSRAQILEALRHSQTRAREAEEVMKKACAEKEHVVKLVIRQASQIFAYKQWVHLLQLENMYFQFKNSKSQPAAAATVSPMMSLPWAGLGNRKMRKGWPYRKRAKRGRALCDFGKYAVAFALGLGLIGAGFFLGWTVGWMLPTW